MKISYKQTPNFRQTKITDSNLRITKKILEDDNTSNTKASEQILMNKKDILVTNDCLKKKIKRNKQKVKKKTNIETFQGDYEIFHMLNLTMQQDHFHLIKHVYDLSKKKKIFNESKEITDQIQIEKNFVKDLKEFLEDNRNNQIMLKHFPESYTIQNFYENKKKSEYRNHSFIKKFPITYKKTFLSNEYGDDYNFYKIPFVKKIWNPFYLNNYQLKIYLAVIKKFWSHEYIEWTHEGALEFLMMNQFNVMKTIKLIKRFDITFLMLVQKYYRVNTYQYSFMNNMNCLM